MVAKAFSKFLKQSIDFEKFRRIARAIERCMLDDLEKLVNFKNTTTSQPEITYDLASSGLIELTGIPTVQSPETKNTYRITEFGKLFNNIVFDLTI